MALLNNTAEGGASGSGLASGQSGSGSAFSATNQTGGGTIVYSNAQAMHGSQSYLITGPASSAATMTLTTGSTKFGAVRAYFRFNAYPASTSDIITVLNSAGGFACKLQINTSGALIVQNTAAATLTSFAAAVSLNTWYRVEFQTAPGTTSTNGTIKFQYYLGDNLTPVNSYSSAVVNAGTTAITGARYGKITNATTTHNAYWDDVAVRGDSATPIGPRGYSAISTLTDSFNTTSLNTSKWTEFTAGGATTAYTAGGAVFTFPTSTTATTDADIVSVGNYDLTGDAVYFEAIQFPNAAGSSNGGMRVYNDANNWIRWVYETGTMYAQTMVLGVKTTVFSVAYNATNHKQFRIRESGDIVYWDTSDGTTWTNQASTAIPISVSALKVLLAAVGNTTETSPGTFQFKNLNTTVASQTLIVPVIASTAVTYAPSLTPGPVTLTAPQIPSATVLYAPAVAPGPVTLTVPAIASTTVLYAPTVIPTQFLQVPFLASNTTMYAPTVSQPSPVSLVQSGTYSSAGGFTEQVQGTLPVATTLNNILIAVTTNGGINDETTTMTDSQGNTWVKMGEINNTSDPSTARIWYTVVTSPGTTNVIFTSTTPSYRLRSMIVMEFNGLDRFNLPDGVATNAINGYTQTHTSGTLTTANPNDLLIGFLAGNNNNAALSSQVGQGWGSTILQIGSTPYNKTAVHYQTVTTTGSYQSTFVDATEYMTTANGIAAFRVAPPVSNQYLTMPTIASTATTYAPTLTPGPVTLTAPQIPSATVLYAPALKQVISVPFISSATVLYPPTVGTPNSTLVVPFIASTTVLYAPTVVPGVAQIAVPFIPSATSLYGPTLIPGPVTIVLPRINSTTVLYVPAVKLVLKPPLIVLVNILYPPSLTQTARVRKPRTAYSAGPKPMTAFGRQSKPASSYGRQAKPAMSYKTRNFVPALAVQLNDPNVRLNDIAVRLTGYVGDVPDTLPKSRTGYARPPKPPTAYS